VTINYKKTMLYPLKININLELSNEVKDFCIAINQYIVNEGFNEINFQGFQQQLPHITLLMGEIKTQDDYLNLIRICNLFSQKCKTIEVSMPYWKKPLEKFVFVDVLPLEEFTKLRLELYEDVKELIKCSAHGGPSSETHITVGYADSIDAKDLDLNIISLSSFERLGVASSVRICRAGVHGTCGEIFNQFYFN
jgi:hypothetical protein